MGSRNPHVPFVSLVALTVALLCLAAGDSSAEDGSGSHANWMSQHKEQLKKLPINQVTLLGSHDSASCDIHEGSPPVTGYLTHSGKHKEHPASARDVGSAVCQSASIKAQLEYGVRHLDLRIAWQDGEYWGTHMFISTPAFGPGGVFTQIKDFLKEHPDEVVIMIAEHLYSQRAPMTSGEAVEFYRKAEREFGDLLVECGDFSETTYGDIWAGSGRIILIAGVESGWGTPPPQHKHKHKHGHPKKPSDGTPATRPDSGSSSTDIADDPYLWCGYEVDSKWMDVQDPDVLISDLDGVIAKWRNGASREKLRRLQAMTTTGHKLGTAKVTNAKVRERLQSGWKDASISVVQVDDAVHSGLMPILIEKLDRQSQP